MSGDESYRNSSALLAIHSAVSYSDALRVGLGDDLLSADDHRKAADRLERILSSKGFSDRAGLNQLGALISKKSMVAYSDRRLSEKDYQLLLTHAERFAKWANNIGRELNIGGWQNDDL